MAGANLAPSLVDPYRTESEDEEGEDSGSKRERSPGTTPVKGKDARVDDARAGAEQSRVEEGGVAGVVGVGGSSTATEGEGALETGMGGATGKVTCEGCGRSFKPKGLPVHLATGCGGGGSVEGVTRRWSQRSAAKPQQQATGNGGARRPTASHGNAAPPPTPTIDEDAHLEAGEGAGGGAEGPFLGCGAGGAATGGGAAAEKRADRQREINKTRNVQTVGGRGGRWVKKGKNGPHRGTSLIRKRPTPP